MLQTDKNLKILLLTHRVPFPQNGGYAIVVCNTVKGLIALGHEVCLLSLNARGTQCGQPDEELAGRINFRAFNIDISVSVMDVAINLFSSTSFNIDRYYDEAFEKMLAHEVRNTQYDIIQFEGLRMSLYLPIVRKNSSAKLIFRAHIIESQLWERMALQKTDPFKKSYLRMHARRIRNYEMRALNKFDAISTFTGQDQKTLIHFPVNVPVEVLRVGVDMSTYVVDQSKTEFPSLFFLGSLDWLPNREGMEWFLDNFSKSIEDGELAAKLYVAGNDIPEAFDDYEVMGKIFIQGEVDDALEFVNSKSIMIVPLLSSGGMRVKIVEGMAMQKCIISTSLGAEGIAYTHGENIVIANNRNEFFDAIKRCIKNEEYCKTIGNNARKLIEKEHDINFVTEKLVGFYQKCLDA